MMSISRHVGIAALMFSVGIDRNIRVFDDFDFAVRDTTRSVRRYGAAVRRKRKLCKAFQKRNDRKKAQRMARRITRHHAK